MADPDPRDLAFEVVSQHRPFALVAPGFVAVDGPGPEQDGLVRADTSPVAPYAAVEVDVHAPPGSSARVMAGLATADGEHVLAVHDPGARRVSIEVRRTGRTRVVRRRRVVLPPTYRLAFVLCENQVTALADTGEGWTALLTAREPVVALGDLRDPERLARHAYAWGTGTAGGAPTRLARVRAGLFGMTGLRDLHLVQHADGSPYLRDGQAYLTATCAGTGFFPQAHWGVFRLDLADPGRLVQTAQLFTRRDGLVLGDHAGALVRDDDRWLVATSSWGDFDGDGVHVRHAASTDDLLEGVHLLATEPVPLPTGVSAWDPGLTRVDGTWLVSFVESPSQRPFVFHPALAAADGPAWTDGLRLVGAAEDLRQCEGPVLVTLGRTTWLLASDATTRTFPVFTTAMRPVGRLDAPYPSNIPHPQLVPVQDGVLMVTFEGTPYGGRVLGYGGHGDVVVMHARSGAGS